MERLRKQLTILFIAECAYLGGLRMVSGQNCQPIVSSAMNEYKACIENTYKLLFGRQYKDMTSEYAAYSECRTTTYFQCKEAAKQKLAGCLDFFQREAMDITFQATDAGIAYFCDNKGRNLLEYYRRMIPNCYFGQQSNLFLRECERENPLINVNLVPYTQDYCRSQNNVIQCLQSIYDQCLPYENPEFMRSYFLAIWTRTPCWSVERQPLLSGSNSNVTQASSKTVLGYFLVLLMAALASSLA